MASIKTINFLPSVFRTETNQKFLNATLDQLVTPPDLRKINGYVGRTTAPTFDSNDNYQPEPTALRQNYQLEPSVVVKNNSGNVEFFSSYIDLLQQIDHEGGLTNNQSRLFAGESYSFDGLFDFDKFVNFNQYYWLPNGPTPVNVYGSDVDTERTYVVTRDPSSGTYNISGYGTLDNPTLKLTRGGTYTFVIDQPGFPFWIQSYPGVDGIRPRQNNITTREILGVTNNGTDSGIITFTVPSAVAQDYYTRMPLVATVDLSTNLSYKSIQNQLLSVIVDTFNGIDGSISQLVNKTLIFTNSEIDDIQWTLDGETVPEGQRFSVWKIKLTATGTGDFTFTLVPDIQVSTNQKVYVKGGITNGGFTFFSDPDARCFTQLPDITATSARLYYQDGTLANMVGSMDIFNVGTSTIDANEEILGKKNYTSPNGVVFTNGLVVKFDSSVLPARYYKLEYRLYNAWYNAIVGYGANNIIGDAEEAIAYRDGNLIGVWDSINFGELYPDFYVEGVGSSIRLLPLNEFINPENYASGGLLSPDYITINRSSIDLNGWSRSNRWFHIDVIKAAAGYNNTVAILDQSSRAKRPIIEFDPDLQLFNYGRVAKTPVDLLNFTITDAFEEIQLQPTFTLDGVELTDGMRIIFANDADIEVKNDIYVITIEYIDSLDLNVINLIRADDFPVSPNNSVLVKQGTNQGLVYNFTGTDWVLSQAKTSINQSPLFDVINTQGYSLSDSTLYPNSTFIGNKIFSYSPATGTNDVILGFPLSYRNFNQIGDIQFVNNFDNDTFNYDNSTGVLVNSGTIRKNIDIDSFVPRNVWVKNIEESKQFQIIRGTFNGVGTGFEIDISPKASGRIPNLRVYKNSKLLSDTQYAVVQSGIRQFVNITDASLAVDDHIDILIYSDNVSELGYYEVPKNLDFNTENKNFIDLTLGQLRNHLVTIVENSNRVIGAVPGASNIRDLSIKSMGGSIVQHASPVLYSELFLVDANVNFLKGLDLARHEYSNIKNKFLELAVTSPEVDISDAVATTNLLLKKINEVKNKTFPWYYSDMVPYGDNKTTISYDIINAQIRGYEITSIFDDTALSNRAILIYINGQQLIKGVDYTFDTNRAGFTIDSNFSLEAGDRLDIVEYNNTDGNYIPETPTKLGLYPKFTPSIYVDNTYQTPIEVIQGHDGSITPAFGDFRDALLLEFEKRIYNNIKISYEENEFNLYNYLPGKFRDQDYEFSEFNRLLTSPFLKWAGGNRVDFTNNTYFQSGNPWTWNYRRFRDLVNGEALTGAWRSIFKYFYDTDRPHTHPWEMLGFSEQPDWWETRYGPAPYTGGNLVLWRELSQGYIHSGPRAGYDVRFVRPNLTNFIPVDEYGVLRSPDQFLVTNFSSNEANASYSVGEQGPVETAWRRSSDFPFAMQQAIALSRPGYYFGSLMNVDRYFKNDALDQYVLSDTLGRITPTQVNINGDTTTGEIVRTAGYLNWIADYLKNLGIDPIAKISGYLKNVSVQLAYKMAGYSDKSLLQVIAEQSSPTSTNSGIVIPSENYNLLLHKSTPVSTVVYSAVIIERSENGYTVSGYNQDDPFFTIIPSIANNNAYGIKVNDDTGVIYEDFQKYKITVPYGYEFRNKQQIVDFLISYERYLTAVGMNFTNFDSELETQRDFKLSVREFLIWSQQGWGENNLIVLSPVLDTIKLSIENGTVDAITNTPNGSRILGTNFDFIRNNQFTVTRTENRFSLRTNIGQTIALASLEIVEYEHALIFDNTTVFNDIIYKPELGNRQYRLRLVGNKTGSWTGILNPPGFIYNNPTIDEWRPGIDFKKGSLVIHKTQYYVALSNLDATSEFNITSWAPITSDQIKTGLLPNFSYNAQKFNNLFDVNNPEPTMGMTNFSQRMIGFSPRKYMTDFGIDQVTQAKFYQGFIKEKGTINAINAFTAAGFNGVTSTINLYEEWAMRLGEYGSIENNQFVEVTLVEEQFTGDPITFTLLPNGGASSDRTVGVLPNQLYRKPAVNYSPNIFIDRDETSTYYNDIKTAGYVSVNDVDTTIFDIGNYRDLNSVISKVTVGYKIWCAKDFSGDWTVYRAYETNSVITSINYSIDNVAEITTRRPNNFAIGDLLAVKGFDSRIDGFYQVININSAVSFNVILSGIVLEQIRSAQSVTGLGTIFRLQSLRLKQDTDVATLTPPKTWKNNDKLWVDDSGDSNWVVYNKSTPWSEADLATSSMVPQANTQNRDSGFGGVVAINNYGNLAAASATSVMNGNVLVFTANLTNGNILTQFANIGTTDTVTNFGSSLDIKGNILYVGTPGNGTTHHGRVYVYRHNGNITLTPIQTITSNWASNTGNKFGQSISASADGTWLFVGAPNKGNVEVFHSNANSYYTYANTISVGSNATAAFGSLVKTTSDASQTIIAAPYEAVSGVSAAGTVYVYDRSIETFAANGRTAFFTANPINSSTLRVSLNGVRQSSGFTSNATAVTFTNPPDAGSPVTLETNKFQLMQQLVDPKPKSGSAFGSASDISGDDADIYISSPGFSEPGYHSGVVHRFVNSGERYGTVLGSVSDPLVTINDSIRINGQLITFSNIYLANVVSAINSANITGVSASSTNSNALLITSNIITTVDKLVITPGNSANVLANLGVNVYTNIQTIYHLGQDDVNGFGSKLAISPDGYSLAVSGPGSTTYNTFVIDNGATIIDQGATSFLDPIMAAGAVYVYGLVGSSLSGAAQDQLVFVQRLQNTNLSSYDQFGSSLASSSETLLVGAPGDDSDLVLNEATGEYSNLSNAGAIYTYKNLSGNVGWDIIRTQESKVDLDSINRLYLFDTATNTILTNLDYIDPIKGKLLGAAQQDIDYWTAYDPAVYNVAGGTDYVTNDVSVNLDFNWGAEQVGRTWWNVNKVRFIDYEQGNITYRSNSWSDLFPGSQVQVAEWVVSNNPPSQYTGDGEPLYPVDNSVYVSETFVDPNTKILRSRYYFWVINKNSVDTLQTSRRNSIVTLEEMISNPQTQGIPYAAVLRNDTVSLYNVNRYIKGNSTVLHMDYDYVKNDNIIHSEYQLVQEGNNNSIIPDRIVNKLRDSLAGQDQFLNLVPDPALPMQSNVGISRDQSIFIDRLTAVKNWAGYVNSIMLTVPVINDFNIDRLYTAQEQPLAEDYDLAVNSYEELGYINVNGLSNGYVVLVINDETQRGLWTTYTFVIVDEDTAAFVLTTTQSYYTPFYWSKIDWYDSTYDYTIKPVYQVNNIADIQKLVPRSGDTVKVLNNGRGQWEIYRFDDSLVENLVGVQNGTIQLNDNLWNTENSTQYEIRVIFDALQQDIFKERLSGKFNEMFFFLINYILTEQKTVDWIFKTSFVSIVHQLRKLEQFPNYIRDNQTYYENYISEVKPYRTSLREYLLNYQVSDLYENNITDFDIPSTYDSDLKIYRSPDLTLDKDEYTLANDTIYQDWYNNYGYGIGAVEVVNAGNTNDIPVVTLNVRNANVTVNAGDYITQPVTGANGVVQVSSVDSIITLQNVTGAFTNILETLTLDSNANVYVGNTIVQLSTGAYGNVFITSTGNTVILSNVVGEFGNSTVGNAYIYRNGANLAANVTTTTIDNAYIFNNDSNLQVNVDAINFYTLSFGGYYETPLISVVGGGGSGARVIAHINPTYSNIARFEVVAPGSGYTSQPTITINGTGSGALGYARLVGEYYVDSLPTTQLTLSANVTVYEGNLISQPISTAQGYVYTTSNNANVITLTDVTGTFTSNTSLNNFIYTLESNLGAKITSINNFTQFVDRSYNKVRTFDSVLKFDRIGSQLESGDLLGNISINGVDSLIPFTAQAYYGTKVIDWASNITIPANTTVRYDGVAYRTTANVYNSTTMKLNGNITVVAGDYITQDNNTANAQVVTSVVSGNVLTVANISSDFLPRGGNLLINSVAVGVRPSTVTNVFDYSQFTKINASDFDNANDRIAAYYSPLAGMPGRDLDNLVSGLEYPGVRVQGVKFNAFSSNITSNIISYHHSNLSLISSNIITRLTLSTNANVWVGNTITQLSTGAYGNVYSISTGNVVTLSRVVGVFSSNAANIYVYRDGANLTANVTAISNVNDYFDFTTTEYATGEYLTVSNLDLPVSANLTFKIVNITNDRLQLSEIAGATFSIAHGSNVSLKYYDFHNPINLDSTIQSAYQDSDLGLRAEDINIDGGAYYDTFSSHSPEELIPGQLFDHVAISVYTKILSNTQIVGYRMVTNARSEITSNISTSYWPDYYRISASNTTVLTSNLNITDSNISVGNASVLASPNVALNIPGAIYVNGEKIVYWRNYATEAKTAWVANILVASNRLITYSGNTYLTSGNVYAANFANITANVTQVSNNTLAQIRRSADKTGAPLIHIVGSTVDDLGYNQKIPSTGLGVDSSHKGTWLNFNANVDLVSKTIIDDLGNELTDDTGNTLVTSTVLNAPFDGTGIEGSTAAQAMFVKGL